MDEITAKRQYRLRQMAHAQFDGKSTPDGRIVLHIHEPQKPDLAKLRAEAAEKIEEKYMQAEAGEIMPDGSVCGGSLENGTKIFALPQDLDMAMAFNEAAAKVDELNTENTLGHDDWQIPPQELLEVLCQNREEGSLKETFNASEESFKTEEGSGSVYPGRYWSSSMMEGNNPLMRSGIQFSDGSRVWYPGDSNKLRCRPMRLMTPSV